MIFKYIVYQLKIKKRTIVHYRCSINEILHFMDLRLIFQQKQDLFLTSDISLTFNVKVSFKFNIEEKSL